MKFLLFALLSANIQVQAESWSYQRPALDHFSASGEWLIWSSRIRELGLDPVTSHPQQRYYGFDHVAMSSDGRRGLMIRMNLQGTHRLPSLVKSKTGILVHRPNSKGTHDALFFIGYSETEIKSQLRSWRSPGIAATVWHALMPIAEARLCGGIPPRWQASNVQEVADESLLSSVGACAVSALDGLNGRSEGIKDFFVQLWNDPTSLYEEAYKQFVQLKDFVLNIRTEFKNLFAALKGVSAPIVQELICQMVGQSVPELALKGVVGGVAGAVILIQQAITRVVKVKGVLIAASRAAELGRLSSDQTRALISGLIHGDQPIYNTLHQLQEAGLAGAAQALILCGVIQ